MTIGENSSILGVSSRIIYLFNKTGTTAAEEVINQKKEACMNYAVKDGKPFSFIKFLKLPHPTIIYVKNKSLFTKDLCIKSNSVAEAQRAVADVSSLDSITYNDIKSIDQIGPLQAFGLYYVLFNTIPPIEELVASEMLDNLLVGESPSFAKVMGYWERNKDLFQQSTVQPVKAFNRVVNKELNNIIKNLHLNPYVIDDSMRSKIISKIKESIEVKKIGESRYVFHKDILNSENRLNELSSDSSRCRALMSDEEFKDMLCNDKNFFYLDEDQKAALERIFTKEDGLICITGGPGNGKSELIVQVINILKKLKSSGFLSAYTNKAVSNLKQRVSTDLLDACLIDTYTRASLRLAYITPEKMPYQLKKTRVLIVDESSMMASSHLSRIFTVLDTIEKCTNEPCKLIFVGDPNQLEPVVTYGHPYLDILKVAPTVSLTHPHRSGCDGILNTINYIKSHRKLAIDNSYDSVKSLKMNEQTATQSISAMYKKSKTPKDLSVIAPTHNLCYTVNRACFMDICQDDLLKSEYIAKSKTSKRYSIPHIFEGSVVKCVANVKSRASGVYYIKNNFYLIKSIRNSEVSSFMLSSKRNIGGYATIVDDKDNEFDVPLEELKDNSVIAFCSTVHSYQGSENNSVIYLTNTESPNTGFFLNINMNYVAVSRSIKKLYLIQIDERVSSNKMKKQLIDCALESSKRRVSSINIMDSINGGE